MPGIAAHDVVSAVSGVDCSLVGLVVGSLTEHSPGEALRRAVAAGAANALRFSTGEIGRGDLAPINTDNKTAAIGGA